MAGFHSGDPMTSSLIMWLWNLARARRSLWDVQYFRAHKSTVHTVWGYAAVWGFLDLYPIYNTEVIYLLKAQFFHEAVISRMLTSCLLAVSFQ